MTEPGEGFVRLLSALDKLEVRYMVTGSLASSAHGILRATQDVDLVADLRPEHVEPLAASLESEFYLDRAMIRESLRTGRAFNLIHLSSSYKFDIFPLSRDPWSELQFSRRKEASTTQFGDVIEFDVCSIEDTMLNKLEWFRRGGEVSDQQWNDVRSMVEVKHDQLDLDYLRARSAELGVSDLLERVLAQRHRPRL